MTLTAAHPPITEGHRRAAFFGMAWVSVAFIAASAAPSPVYVLFQASWHFDSWLLSLAFSIYAFTLLAALLSVGSISDRVGRRPVLIAALGTEIAAMALLLFASDLTHVLIARAVQGFATGAATSTVSAALADLSPIRNRQLGATVASITPLAGLAAGSLAAGLIIQALAQPIPVIFTALIVILLVELVLVVLAPETIEQTDHDSRRVRSSLVPRLHVPVGSRSAFLASSFLNIGVWLTTSLVLGLLPQIDRDVFAIHSGIANGGIIALLTGVGAVSVVLGRSFSARRSALIAALALVTGAGLEAVAVAVADVWVFAAGAAVAGIGTGVGFSGYIRLVISHVEPEDRAGVFAAMYVVSYLTFGIPVIIAGLVLSALGTTAVAIGFCGLTITASLIGFLVINRHTAVPEGGSR